MTALATVHATAYGYQQDCGGRKAFLERYPIIKDQNRLPKFSQMKVIKYLFPLKAKKMELSFFATSIWFYSNAKYFLECRECSYNAIFGIHESSAARYCTSNSDVEQVCKVSTASLC